MDAGRGLQDEPPGIQNHTPSGSDRVVRITEKIKVRVEETNGKLG